MKPKKKTRKAVTLLTKIETLLSDVLDECSALEKSAEKNVRELLLSAEGSITKAKDFVLPPSSEVRHKVLKSRARKHPVAKSKAKPSVRVKKRSAAPAT